MFGVPLHVAVVHFPVALAIVALVYDLRGFTSRTPELHETGYRLTLWSAAGAGLAVMTGLQLLGGYVGKVAGPHAGAGIAGAIGLVVLAMLRYSARARHPDAPHTVSLGWLVLEIFACGAIAVAAVLGHRLVFAFT